MLSLFDDSSPKAYPSLTQYTQDMSKIEYYMSYILDIKYII